MRDRSPLSSGDARALLTASVLALTVPLMAHSWVQGRVDDLSHAIADTTRTAATIGAIEAELTGAVHVFELDVPGLLAAERVTAAVRAASLTSGKLELAEVELFKPVLELDVRDDGSSNLGRILARTSVGSGGRESATAAGPSGAAARSHTQRRFPRIRIADGMLRAKLAGQVEMQLRDVQVHSTEAGLRFVSGEVAVQANDRIRVHATFPRAAADLETHTGRIRRAIATDGIASVGQGHTALRVDHLVASLGLGSGAELSGRTHGAAGVARFALSSKSGALQADLHDFPLAALQPMAPTWVDLTDARMSGAILKGAAGAVQVQAELDAWRIAHPVLATEPVVFDMSISGRAQWNGSRLEVDDLRLQRSDLTVEASGTLAPARPEDTTLSLRVPKVSCQAALDAVPLALRRTLVGLELRGSLVAELEVSPEGQAAPRLEHDCSAVTDAPLGDPNKITRPFDIERDGAVLEVGRGNGYAPLRSLPRHVFEAFVAAEDSRFWKHSGFDPRQIARSLEANMRSGKVLRGGSTISQQLVKNVYLQPRRTLARKLQEAVITWRVEATTSKRRILEAYLNVIELGPRIYGIEAASQYWFGRSAKRLKPEQAAFLAALTRAPSRETRRIQGSGAIPDDLTARSRKILARMHRAKVLSDSAHRRARSTELQLAPLTTAIRSR